MQPGQTYFLSKFFGDSAPLQESLAAFRDARLFVPHKLVDSIGAVDTLTFFSFLNKPSVSEK